MNTGDIIKKLRIEHGLSQEQLGEIIGVQKSAVAKYESGRVENLKRSTIEILSNYFNVSPSYLLGFDDIEKEIEAIELEHNKRMEDIINQFPELHDIDDTSNTYIMPVLGYVRGGEPNLAYEDIIDVIYVPYILNKTEHFALKIRGDSMSPRILENDIVIVHKQTHCNDGDICIVMINGDEATCKQIKKSEAGITLLSFNPSYAPLFYSNEEIENLPVYILGKVIELRGII